MLEIKRRPMRQSRGIDLNLNRFTILFRYSGFCIRVTERFVPVTTA